jgi:hypothetical protein
MELMARFFTPERVTPVTAQLSTGAQMHSAGRFEIWVWTATALRILHISPPMRKRIPESSISPGRGCNATYGGTATAGAFAFWDRGSATGSIAGASHFSADKINYKLGSVSAGGYGLVYESAKINLTISAGGSAFCTTYPTGYPQVNGSGTITGAVITSVGAGCTNGTGLTCTISSAQGGTGSCTATISGNVLTGLAASGSGFSGGSMHGVGPRVFSNWTFVGDNTSVGDPTSVNMKGGVLIEGSISPVVQDGHCEWYTDDCVKIGGGTAQTIGGVIRSINPSHDDNTIAVVHLGTNGSNQTMSTIAEDTDIGIIGSTPPNTLQDDQHGITLSSTNWPHVAYYAPGAMASSDGQAFTLLGHINNNVGLTGYKDNAGTCTLSGTCASITFSTPWLHTPVCTASDQTNIASLKVVPTPTTLTITGSSIGDVIAYQCQGNPN